MGVSGELQVHARLRDDGQPVGNVVEQNAGGTDAQVQRLKKGAQMSGVGCIGIRHADHLKTVYVDALVVQDANASTRNGCRIFGSIAEVLVVAAAEERAELRAECE